MSTANKSQGSLIQLSDLNDWYNTFNSFANSYGTSSMRISMSNTTKPVAADYNTLINIVGQYRNDEYLSTIAWPSGSNVSAGTVMTLATAHNGIQNIRNVQQRIRCRNKATYANENHGNGTANSYDSYDHESFYNEGHISLSNTYYNCCQGRWFGHNNNGAYTHSNVTKSNGGGVDVLNSKTTA